MRRELSTNERRLLILGKNLRSACLLSVVVFLFCVFFGGVKMSCAQSSAQCEGYARDYANRVSSSASGGGALGGAARGAAGGAIIGAISGNAGRGAAIGAGVGGVVGGARRTRSWSQYYDQAYADCMRGVR